MLLLLLCAAAVLFWATGLLALTDGEGWCLLVFVQPSPVEFFTQEELWRLLLACVHAALASRVVVAHGF